MKFGPIHGSLRRVATKRLLSVLIVLLSPKVPSLEAQVFGQIEGQISTETGERVPGVQVLVMPKGQNMVKYSSALDSVTNKFSISRVQPGEYDVAFCDGLVYAPVSKKRIKVVAGDSAIVQAIMSVILTTEPFENVIASREGVPVKGTAVKLIHKGTGCVVDMTITDCQGRFKFRKVPSETYDIDSTGVSDPNYIRKNACPVRGSRSSPPDAQSPPLSSFVGPLLNQFLFPRASILPDIIRSLSPAF